MFNSLEIFKFIQMSHEDRHKHPDNQRDTYSNVMIWCIGRVGPCIFKRRTHVLILYNAQQGFVYLCHHCWATLGRRHTLPRLFL